MLSVPNVVLLAVKMEGTTIPALLTADSSVQWVIGIWSPVVNKLRAFLGMCCKPYIELFFVPAKKECAAAHAYLCLCLLPGVCAAFRYSAQEARLAFPGYWSSTPVLTLQLHHSRAWDILGETQMFSLILDLEVHELNWLHAVYPFLQFRKQGAHLPFHCCFIFRSELEWWGECLFSECCLIPWC